VTATPRLSAWRVMGPVCLPPGRGWAGAAQAAGLSGAVGSVHDVFDLDRLRDPVLIANVSG